MIDYLHCYACERIIPERQDDIVLGNKRTGELRFFHASGSCREWADVAYFSLAECDPDWRITHRYVYWSQELAEGLEAS